MTDAGLDAGGKVQPEQGAGHARRLFRGVPVVIDRPIGFKQKGVDPEGTAWEREYKNDYGYIDGTAGGDGEALDVFLGDDPEDPDAHWIIQQKEDGSFDEYKIVLGAGSAEKAKAIYLAHVPSRFLKSTTETTVEMLKGMLGIHPVEVMKRILVEVVAKALEDATEYAPPMTLELVDRAAGDVATSSAAVVVAKAADASAAEQRYILAPVLIPETTDAQGDIISADVIEKAAWLWASDFRNMGYMHKALVNDKIQMVETYIARADHVIEGCLIKAGTWMVGAIIKDDGLWNEVKTGKMNAWSIGGFAVKRELDGTT